MWKLTLHDANDEIIWVPGIVQVHERIDLHFSRHFTVQFVREYLKDKDWRSS